MLALIVSLSIPWAIIWSALIALAIAAGTSLSIFGSINQGKIGVPQNNRWYPCPAAITSGMPVLIGTQAAVAQDAYDSSTGGATFHLDGSFFLTVIGQSTQSPVAGVGLTQGQELFASGTLDAPTNITYNLTIDATRGNCPYGNLEAPQTIGAGITNTSALVRLKTGGSPGPYGA